MNKVIFICLLSLSMCFSAPTDTQVSGQQTAAVPAVETKTASAAPVPHNETPETKLAPATNPVPDNISQKNQTTPNSTVDNKTDKQKAEDKTAPSKQPQEAKDAPKTADDKPGEPKGHEEKPSTNPTDVKPHETDKPNSSSKADEKSTNDKSSEPKGHKEKKTPTTTTPTDVQPNAAGKPNSSSKTDEKSIPTPEVPTDKNTKTTEAPKTDDKKEVVLQSRGFDGPSFFGGIILTLGMLAIGFIGFKYYRTQTERNYHTL